MAFNWTLIKTDTPVGEGDRQYWGYDVSVAGLVLNVRVRMKVPGAYATEPQKGMEDEVYLPGDSVATFNPVWTLLKTEDFGNNYLRYTHAYATPGNNVLLRRVSEAGVLIHGQLRTFVVDEGYTVIPGATLSGTAIVTNP